VGGWGSRDCPDASSRLRDGSETTVEGVSDARSAPVPPKTAWWRDDRRRNRVALIAFAAVAGLSMLYAAVATQLLAGDRRVLVVTMAQDADQADREALKAACGSLPSVTVVADRGNPDPRVQGRFPVRFAIAGASVAEEAALTDCVNQQPGVRGFLVQRGD
jgi:hypothetical protein